MTPPFGPGRTLAAARDIPPISRGGLPGVWRGRTFSHRRVGAFPDLLSFHTYICVPEAVGVRGGHFRPFDFMLPVRTLGEKLRNPPSETRKGQSGTTLVCVAGSLTFTGKRTGHWRARTDLNNTFKKRIYIYSRWRPTDLGAPPRTMLVLRSLL